MKERDKDNYHGFLEQGKVENTSMKDFTYIRISSRRFKYFKVVQIVRNGINCA